MKRRTFLIGSSSAVALVTGLSFGKADLNHKERVDRALKGSDVDRPPFSFWHHFGLKTPEAHAARTLEFHRKYRTDIVKVMSDFEYPASTSGEWFELKPVANPFPQQIRALELIRDGLGGDAYFIETVFNSWNVAEKLSSKEKLNQLKREKPQALLNALEAINKSQIAHAKRALEVGAAGVLLSVANANTKELSVEDYKRFSLPFDKELLSSIGSSKLTVLHLHVERPYLSLFKSFSAPVINYSDAVSGIPLSDVRHEFKQVIAGGINEVDYKTLSEADLRKQIDTARQQIGSKFILTPGCSVPNDSTAEQLSRLPQLLGA